MDTSLVINTQLKLALLEMDSSTSKENIKFLKSLIAKEYCETTVRQAKHLLAKFSK